MEIDIWIRFVIMGVFLILIVFVVLVGINFVFFYINEMVYLVMGLSDVFLVGILMLVFLVGFVVVVKFEFEMRFEGLG